MQKSTDLQIDVISAPYEPLVSKDTITIFDVLRFLMKWKFVLVSSIGIGIAAGYTYSILSPPLFESSITLENYTNEAPSNRNSKDFNGDLARMSGQSLGSRQFAVTFFAELTALSEENDQMAQSAKKASDYFTKKFGSMISRGSPNTANAVDGFTVYLTRTMHQTLNESKTNSLNYLVSPQNRNIVLILGTEIPGITAPVTVATAKGLNKVIPIFNEKISDLKQDQSDMQISNALQSFDETSGKYLAVRPEYETKKASIMIKFHRLEHEISLAERKSGNISPEISNNPIFILNNEMNASGSSTKGLAPVSEEIEALEYHKLVKRIGWLADRIVVDKAQVSNFLDQLSAIERALQTQYAKAIKAHQSAQIRLNKILETIIKPDASNTGIWLPRVARDKDLLISYEQSKAFGYWANRLPLFMCVGIVATLITTFALCLALELKGYYKKAIAH